MLAKKKAELQNKTKVNTLNTPYLVIVESPSKCAKIEKYLGFAYKCIASKGHICEIKSVAKSKDHYQPTYEIIKEKAQHVSWMKTIVSQFDKNNIFIGSDDDREGEAIGWHVCQVCGLDVNTTKRIIFHEVTQTALKKAIETPCTIRMNIVHAQQARQVLDRMIGFQISPILSRLVVHDNSKFLSAGRCQTPTLRLIYDRFIENSQKKEKLHYKVQASFFPHPSSIDCVLNKTIENEILMKEFLEKSKTFAHNFQLKTPKSKSSAPPKPFNTSHLLQYASNSLHMSPKHVMDCCQSLYQEGYITYMRTESKQYAKGFLSQVDDFIKEKYGEDYLGDLGKLENTQSNNPHEAIRVTNLDVLSIDHKDKKAIDVYQLIHQRTLESCMSHYQYSEHSIGISSPLPEAHYNSSIEIPSFLGYKRYSTREENMRNAINENGAKVSYLGKFNNKVVKYNFIGGTLSMKELDKHYNEASLIQKLESIGIGRPSTYSMLVDTIQQRSYVNKENIEGEVVEQNEYMLKNDVIETKMATKSFGSAKNKLILKDLGKEAIQLLYTHFASIFDYNYSSEMECRLDELVNDPSIPWYSVVEQCEKTLDACLKPIKNKMKKSYVIDEKHEFIFGKAGAMIRVIGGEEKTYKSLKPNLEIDFDKLEKQLYKLSDLIELETDSLGIYENEEMKIKKGPYGAYVTWGDKKNAIETLVKRHGIENITLSMVIDYIEDTSREENKTILRVYNNECSLRKGRYGNYIFYKTEKMKKPKFINIKKCPHDLKNDDGETIVQWALSQLGK